MLCVVKSFASQRIRENSNLRYESYDYSHDGTSKDFVRLFTVGCFDFIWGTYTPAVAVVKFGIQLDSMFFFFTHKLILCCDIIKYMLNYYSFHLLIF